MTDRITASNLIPLLLECCPGARWRWEEHLASWSDEPAGSYNDLSVFAHHIVDRHAAGITDEHAALFRLIEQVLTNGDEESRELVAIGLLEDIQVIASNQPFGAAAFVPWLGPQSRAAWQTTTAQWAAGGESLAGVIRDEAERVTDREEPLP